MSDMMAKAPTRHTAATRAKIAATQTKRGKLSLWRRPPHAQKYEHGSRPWFEACNGAFVAAMLANPSERPE
jgi:hypothetical protein